MYLDVLDSILASPSFLFFIRLVMNTYSQCNRKRSAKRGLQLPPIGIPLTCRNANPPKVTKTSSMMYYSVAFLKLSIVNESYPLYLILDKKLFSNPMHKYCRVEELNTRSNRLKM